jgi:hypothetical protein
MTSKLSALVVLCVATALPLDARAQTSADSGEPREPSSAVRFRFDDRPVLELGSGMRLELGGRFEGDLVGRSSDDRDMDARWGDRRLELAGDLVKRVRFELSADVSDAGSGHWRDAFVDVRVIDGLALRGGRFKVPFSEERTRGAGRLDFVRRAMATRLLAPGRDVGFMARARLLDKRLAIDGGWFEGTWGEWTDEDAPVLRERHALVAARVTARPFLRQKKGRAGLDTLRVGTSFLQGRAESGASGFELRTFNRETLLAAPPVGGTRRGHGIEVQWEPGRVRLTGEWILMRDERNGQALDGGDLHALQARGWYTSAVWRVWAPRKAAGVQGERIVRAIDLAARIEGLSLGTGHASTTTIVHPRADEVPWHTLQVVTLGTTVSVTRWVRVQANLLYEDAADNARLIEAGHRWGSLLRLQLAF